jgi:hypothetical protein
VRRLLLWPNPTAILVELEYEIARAILLRLAVRGRLQPLHLRLLWLHLLWLLWLRLDLRLALLATLIRLASLALLLV